MYVIRHGQYDQNTGHLTDAGRAGVAAAAERHLKGLRFQSAYHSGMPRTEETVLEALRATGHPEDFLTHVHGLFGYGWLEALAPGYYTAAKALVAAGRPNTVSTWWETAPPLRLAAHAARGAILGIAMEAADCPVAEPNVLVGSHEWTGIAPTLDGAKPCLGCAGIIRYDVEVHAFDARIVFWNIFE